MQVVGVTDDRDRTERIGVTVNRGDRSYEIVFTPFDDGEYVPAEIVRHDDGNVGVGDVFNGLRAAIKEVEEMDGVDRVPFNRPGFGRER